MSTDTVSFRAALKMSAIGHAAFAILLTVRAFLFPGEPLRLENAIRVDIVGLPEKSMTLPAPNDDPKPDAPVAPPAHSKELPPVAKAKDDSKKVVLKPDKPDPKAAKKSQDAALKRLEALARLEQQAKADAARKALEKAKAGQAAVRGNQISRGNALSGLTRLDHARYLDDLEAKIRSHWSPPKFLAKAGLRVRVLIVIEGGIVRKSLIQSSGNAVFDETAMAAIDSSLPLPLPPDSLKEILARQGVELDLEPAGFR